ncbi:MAG: hypothetical protein ACI9KE_005692, partial [Polyangiales bacterium]
AFATCVKYKLKTIQATAPKEPTHTPAEVRCQTLCDKVGECLSGEGGDGCMARCKDRKNARLFKMYEACGTKECSEYEGCMLGRLGVAASKIPCADACRHELSCAPPGTARDLMAVARCAKKCSRDAKELDAVNSCAVKGCGQAFNACVAEKSGRLAEIKKAKGNCEGLCAKAGECRRASGGKGCVRRCLEGGPSSLEYRVREGCGSQACGEAYDKCLLAGLQMRAADVRCVPACRWDLSCERGNQSGNLEMLQACVKGCKHTDADLELRPYCEPMGCGSGFSTCMDKKRAEAAAAAVKPKGPAIDTPDTKRCKTLCARADTCDAGTGGNACVTRCGDAKASTMEFAAREKCGGKTCGAYGDCVIENMGLTKAGARCVTSCTKQLGCASPGPVLPGAVVGCANECKVSDADVRAAASCAKEACGAAYDTCVKNRSVTKKLSPAEQRCDRLCSQAERCTPGTGGQKCIDRCLEGTEESETEFRVRDKCAKNDCKGYDKCMMDEILGGDGSMAEPSRRPVLALNQCIEPPALLADADVREFLLATFGESFLLVLI